MEEILDDFTEPTLPPNRKGVDKAIWIYAAITAILLLFYEFFLKQIFPAYLFDNTLVSTRSLFMLLVYILICNLLIRKLNDLAPEFEEKIFVIWGASSIFYGSLIFKIINELLIYKNFNPSTLWFIFKISMAMSIISGAISYLVINRIRGNDMTVPYLVLIGVWVATSFLLKIIS